MLFGKFWHQRELCILFADINVGKSVLAMQIGNAIADLYRYGPDRLMQLSYINQYFKLTL